MSERRTLKQFESLIAIDPAREIFAPACVALCFRRFAGTSTNCAPACGFRFEIFDRQIQRRRLAPVETHWPISESRRATSTAESHRLFLNCCNEPPPRRAALDDKSELHPQRRMSERECSTGLCQAAEAARSALAGAARNRRRSRSRSCGAAAELALHVCFQRIHQRLDLRARQWSTQVRQGPACFENLRRIVVHVVQQKDALVESGEQLLHLPACQTSVPCPPRCLRALPARALCRVRFASDR